VPMQKVTRSQALTKSEFHKRLRDWFRGTGEQMIGSPEVDGRTGWIFVQDGGHIYVVHTDTPRKAVEWYLQIVNEEGDNLVWEPALSMRGHMTATVYGSKRQRNTAFYLYAA
jgi:hypothetical protein